MKSVHLIPCQVGLVEHAMKHFDESHSEDIKRACKGKGYTTEPFETEFGPVVFTTLGKEIDTKYLTTVISVNGGTIGQLVIDPTKIRPAYIKGKMDEQLKHCLIPNLAANGKKPKTLCEKVLGEEPEAVAERLFHEKPLMEIDTSKLNKVIHPVWGELKPLSEGLKELDLSLHQHKHSDPDVEVTTTSVGFTAECFIPHICQLFNDLRRPEHGTDDELRAKLKMTKPFWDAFVGGRIHFVSYNVGTLLGEVFDMPAETWVNAGARWLTAYNEGKA